MKTALALIAAFVGLVVLVVTLSFLGTGLELAQYEFWAPKQAAAQNKVFHNTTTYTDGETLALTRLRTDYKTADPAHKAAIKEEIIEEAGNVDLNKLPESLREFIQELESE